MAHLLLLVYVPLVCYQTNINKLIISRNKKNYSFTCLYLFVLVISNEQKKKKHLRSLNSFEMKMINEPKHGLNYGIKSHVMIKRVKFCIDI